VIRPKATAASIGRRTALAKAKSDLAPFQPLIKPRPRVGDEQFLSDEDVVGPTSASRIWVADINGDGKLDLLVGRQRWPLFDCQRRH